VYSQKGLQILKSLKEALVNVYNQYIPNVAVLFLFPVSCWSTYSGIRELMRSTGGLSEVEGLFVSIGLTVGIQITLLYAVSSIMRVSLGRRPFYVGIYILTVFFSVLFGYSFYFRHLRADDFAKEVHLAEAERMLLKSEEYLARLRSTSRGLDELAAFSSQQSEIEDAYGGTCGDASPSGRGPRAKGWKKDAELFTRYSQSFGSVTNDLGVEVDNLRSDVAMYCADQLSQHHR
jgi:hypothetical protein